MAEHARPGPAAEVKPRRPTLPFRHKNRNADYRGSTLLLEPPDEDDDVLDPVKYTGRHRAP